MSVTIGTPLQASAYKVLLLGSGELGKEVVISLQRLGVEVHAADRYEHFRHSGDDGFLGCVGAGGALRH